MLFRCWKDFLSDPSNAAAGTRAPTEAQRNNPSEFSGDHDRNLLLISAILFKESLYKETGNEIDLDAGLLWKETCEEPASFRNPIPTWQWRSDPKHYGNQDSFGHVVESSDVAPLRAYGSLRQFRDISTSTYASGSDADRFPEDVSLTSSLFDASLVEREDFSFSAMYQTRICGTSFQYSIEEAMGTPQEHPSSYVIRDTSEASRKQYDSEHIRTAFLTRTHVFLVHCTLLLWQCLYHRLPSVSPRFRGPTFPAVGTRMRATRPTLRPTTSRRSCNT